MFGRRIDTLAGEGREGGFTLLEVLVAFAIAAPAAAAYQEAISRAQSRLDALGDDGLAAGERTGDDGGGFRWRTRIASLASTTPSRPTPRGSPYAAGAALYAVTVEVSWSSPGGARAFTLDTRRVGPAAVVGP